jgi:hypothetical protein
MLIELLLKLNPLLVGDIKDRSNQNQQAQALKSKINIFMYEYI